MKVLKAIYNFLVGDMTILIGIGLAFLLLLLINAVSALAPLRAFSGIILIVVVLVVLGMTLSRELRGREKA